MDKKKIVGTDNNSGGVGSASKNYVNSEESLLEQIRAKEEEQNARIEDSRQQYITDVENARKEAESRLSRNVLSGRLKRILSGVKRWTASIVMLSGSSVKVSRWYALTGKGRSRGLTGSSTG